MLFSNFDEQISELFCLSYIVSLRVVCDTLEKKRALTELWLSSLFIQRQRRDWRDESSEAVCKTTQFLLNLSKQGRENCTRRCCKNMAQSVGDNSCVNTVISCQLSAHVLHLSHVPAERAFVLLGSLSEQTEHEEAVMGLSVCLSVLVVLQLQPLEMLQVWCMIGMLITSGSSWKVSNLFCATAVYVTLARQPLESEAVLHCLNWLSINWVKRNTSTQARSQKPWWKR